MKNIAEKNIIIMKPSKWKYTLVIVAFLLLIIVFVISLSQVKQTPDPESERIIREAVAKQLNKDPNDLTEEDFAKITALRTIALDILSLKKDKHIQSQGIAESAGNTSSFLQGNKLILASPEKSIALSDIKILKKFMNLQELEFEFISFPEKNIPRWMKLLANYGVINLEERFSIDLRPLESLPNLTQIGLGHTHVKNIKPLAKLSKLETLDLMATQVCDLEPLKELKNLKKLNISSCPKITDEQVVNLQNALPELQIIRK